MARSTSALMREGLISSRAASRRGLSNSKSRAQPTRMADFDSKDGVRDQGAGRDRGDAAAGRGHIDKNQDMGSPARASGAPSKGAGILGAVGQPVRRNEIDDGAQQRPDFPAGSRPRKGRKGSPPAQKGPMPPSGPQYGGGGRNTQ